MVVKWYLAFTLGGLYYERQKKLRAPFLFSFEVIFFSVKTNLPWVELGVLACCPRGLLRGFSIRQTGFLPTQNRRVV